MDIATVLLQPMKQAFLCLSILYIKYFVSKSGEMYPHLCGLCVKEKRRMK